MACKQSGADGARGPFQATEFHSTRDPQAVLHWRDEHLSVCQDNYPPQVNTALGEAQVVTAL